MSNVKGKTFTGARCRIMVSGKIIGWGTNVTVNCATRYEDVKGIDSIETLEQAPVDYSVSGSIATVGIVGQTYKSLGLVPRTGKNADEHLLNILQMPEHTLVLMDKAEQRNLLTVTGVKFGEHGWTVAAGGVAGKNVNFQGIRETDESEAAL
jgi:hypothetical protein